MFMIVCVLDNAVATAQLELDNDKHNESKKNWLTEKGCVLICQLMKDDFSIMPLLSGS